MWPQWKCTLCDEVLLTSKDPERAARVQDLHIAAHALRLMIEIGRHLQERKI